ncbi:DUF448 domain-containing protein [Sphingorhabdus arenilitoris]|uniref:DUF448 domain-containing protein n=1 Tax=Sphingorhabdus arenilitoris TaxID=1490041 RepID=A0ABV8RFW1_9SPHN
MLSGKRAENSALIRLALGPDGDVAPDVNAKAPGRGAWIGVTAGQLSEAQAKGKLEGALKHAFKVKQIHLPDDLAERINGALQQAWLNRLGLEARAGNLICGADKVDAAARSGMVHLLLHASDASADGSGKRDQSLRVGRDAEGSGQGGIKLPVDREVISKALGRSNAVHIALTEKKAADRVMNHLGRWLNFNGCGIGSSQDGVKRSESAGSTKSEE